MSATVDIVDKILSDDRLVCSISGELIAYISLPAQLNEDTDPGARYTVLLYMVSQ